MRLGYERILNDNQVTIVVDEVDDPIVVLKIHDYREIYFKASEIATGMELNVISSLHGKITRILDATQNAYKKALLPY